MATQAGRRSHRISLISATPTRDAAGASVQDWDNPTTIATVWAEVVPVRGMERMESAKLDATVEFKFRIQYSATAATVTQEHRVSWRDEQYDITAVIPYGRQLREGIELWATAHQADADG